MMTHGQWLFRMDGAHRAAILRYLGEKTVIVIEFSSADCAKIPRATDCQRGKCVGFDRVFG